MIEPSDRAWSSPVVMVTKMAVPDLVWIIGGSMMLPRRIHILLRIGGTLDALAGLQ